MTGVPNTAITASPMYFSIVPPWRVISALMASKYRDIVSRSDSGSSFSPRSVDPFRSEKRMVTSFRTSCGGGAAASAVPQYPQRRNFGGFSSPQLGQICTSTQSRAAW